MGMASVPVRWRKSISAVGGDGWGDYRPHGFLIVVGGSRGTRRICRPKLGELCLSGGRSREAGIGIEELRLHWVADLETQLCWVAGLELRLHWDACLG